VGLIAVDLYRAMHKKEGIAGKNQSTRTTKADEEAHFFPQFLLMRILFDINFC